MATRLARLLLAPDYRLMKRLHRWHAPGWVRWWMLAATRAGDGWLWYGIGAGILIWGGRNHVAAPLAAIVAAGAGILVFLVLKRLAGRKRPCDLHPHCWSTVLPPDRFSFPSGHTITAFAVSVVWSLAYPALTPWLAFCALSVAASRVILGMHFLSDVLAGALIGSLLGYGAYSILL